LEWAPSGDLASEPGRAAGIVSLPAFDDQGRSSIENRYIHVFDSARDYSSADLVAVEDDLAVMETESEPFRGGVYGWYYGVWSGCYGFQESLLTEQPPEVEREVTPPPYFSSMEPNKDETGQPRISEFGRYREAVPDEAWAGPVSEYSETGMDDAWNTIRTTYRYAAITRRDRLTPTRNGGDTYYAIPRDDGGRADTLACIRTSRSSSLDSRRSMAPASPPGSMGASRPFDPSVTRSSTPFHRVATTALP